jgi:ATP-binding cassette subfamily F protein 3
LPLFYATAHLHIIFNSNQDKNTMITINDLSLQYGEKHIFRNVSGSINNKDRIGLVGVNGTGKSTLLKMIAGETVTDPGIIKRAKGDTTGYLAQEITGIDMDETLYKEAETAFSLLLEKQIQLTAIHDKLSTTDPNSKEMETLLEQQGSLQHDLDAGDIFSMQSSIEKVLMGLGFKTADFDSPCSSFSGGWLMRLMLAKQLLAKPSFLLLDEPTNHLDVHTLTWLEDFLKGYEGGLVIISHDRIFLDNLISSIWEISLGKLSTYKGNYSKYEIDKVERQAVIRAAYDNQQAKIAETMRFVDRFRAKSTKAKQAQSRLKQLDRMDIIELDDQETHVSFKFPPSAPSGRSAVSVENLQKSFGEKHVFAGLNLDLSRGDKLAIVGDNGAGKSTLVKLLAGLIKPDTGEISFGHNVIVSYFGQHQAQELDPRYTVLETMQNIDVEKTITQTRSLLGAFLFKGDDVDKKVKVLSGGEKSRLALAKMIATPANLLIMDEPTNHLDMTSQDILMEAMHQYDGSIIVVSHNRFFLDTFTSKTLEIKDGRGVLYEGNISYYIDKTHDKTQPKQVQAKPSKTAAPKAKGKKARQEQAKLRKQETQILGPLKKEITRLEKEIDTQEEQKTELEQCLADPDLYQDQDKFTEKSKEYSGVQRRLERTYSQWETAQEKLEEAKEKI